MPYLLLLDQKGIPVQEWTLDNQPLYVGRSETMHAFVDDPRMSRKHFKVEVVDGNVVVVDLESTGGIKVNGVKQSTCRLKVGDMIEAGTTQFFYEAGMETLASETPMPTQETTIGKIIKDLRVPDPDKK